MHLFSPASAQAPEAKEITYARELGRDGLDLYEKGDYAKASEKLERAYRLYQVPTLGLWSARALAKIGKLVTASRRYRETAALVMKPTDPAVFRASQADAKKEGEALMPRIPVLTVEVKGADPGTFRVTVDREPIPTALLGHGIGVNLGTHAVEGLRGDERVTAKATLTTGERRTVMLVFPNRAEVGSWAPPVTGLPQQSSHARMEALPRAPDAAPSDDGVEALAWALVGVGAFGVVVGSAFAVAAGDGDPFLLIGVPGAVLMGTGVLILFASAPETPREAARVKPWLGLTSAGVQGRF